MRGAAAERAGTLRAAARLYAAQASLRGPKQHVTVRKAYGFGSSVLAMNPFEGQTLVLAFPGARLGAMPAAGAARAVEASGGRAGERAAGRAVEHRVEPGVERGAVAFPLGVALAAAEAGGPWSAAEGLAYDDVIDPRELRNALLAALRVARGRRDEAARPVARIGVRP
jgi:acetyl-CoA carboxylase carboxyltransferase component